MNFLLDTHTFIWYIQDHQELSSTVAEILEATSSILYLSIASLWEISIKMGLGKLILKKSFSELEELLKQLNITVLHIAFSDLECYLKLPLHHRDPFDRILAAQSPNNSFILISKDVAFDPYSIQRVW